MTRGVYKIKNIKTNKNYIGKSVDIERRFRKHLATIRYNNEHKKGSICFDFVTDARTHGIESLELQILEEINIKDENLFAEKELYWINFYESCNQNKGYNITKNSGSVLFHSAETIERFKKRIIKDSTRRKIGERAKETWKNQNLRDQMASKLKKIKHKYNYIQFSRENVFIKKWDSVDEILEANPSYKWQNIYSVCNGYKPTYMNYIWKKVLKNGN
jgi:group I intron endonuclease